MTPINCSSTLRETPGIVESPHHSLQFFSPRKLHILVEQLTVYCQAKIANNVTQTSRSLRTSVPVCDSRPLSRATTRQEQHVCARGWLLLSERPYDTDAHVSAGIRSQRLVQTEILDPFLFVKFVDFVPPLLSSSSCPQLSCH